MKPLLETLPFDQEIHTHDQAAAWARLVERGLREMAYRRRDDAPALREVSLVEALPGPHICPECETTEMIYDDHAWYCPECDFEGGGEVVALHDYSVKVRDADAH